MPMLIFHFLPPSCGVEMTRDFGGTLPTLRVSPNVYSVDVTFSWSAKHVPRQFFWTACIIVLCAHVKYSPLVLSDQTLLKFSCDAYILWFPPYCKSHALNIPTAYILVNVVSLFVITFSLWISLLIIYSIYFLLMPPYFRFLFFAHTHVSVLPIRDEKQNKNRKNALRFSLTDHWSTLFYRYCRYCRPNSK